MKVHAPALFLIAASVLFISCGSDSPKEKPKIAQPISTEPSPAPAPVKGEGTITGEILFKGVPPVPKRIAVNKDKEACGEFQDSEELIVGPNKGVRWAVVSLRSHPRDMRWESTKLDQRGCRFSPHIRFIPAGSKLTMVNSDGVLHNLHTYSAENSSINKAQPKFKKEMTVEFQKPERFQIGCDIHSWMKGWIVVIDHPYYAVTDRAGGFRLENVTEGKQILEVWHETLGTATMEVEVKLGEVAKVLVTMEKVGGGK